MYLLIYTSIDSFNPCFNGFMDKDEGFDFEITIEKVVSTLVLMDSWIKTSSLGSTVLTYGVFQPLF